MHLQWLLLPSRCSARWWGATSRRRPSSPPFAMQRLVLHDKQVHSVAQVASLQQPQVDLVRAKPDNVRRPEIKKGISEDKFTSQYQFHYISVKKSMPILKQMLRGAC